MNKVDKETLIKLYIDEGKSMHEISNLLNIAIGTVYNYCKKYGIETRNQKETFSFKGKKHSEKVCEILSKTHKGKKLTEETKNKISEARKKGGIGHKKKRKDGYICIFFPDHPRSTKEGYIMEHVLVMEALIGRHLNPEEVVHHINRKRDDNRKENLKLMTFKEHASLHMKERHKQKA